jgi:hypothetical protein
VSQSLVRPAPGNLNHFNTPTRKAVARAPDANR